MRALLVDDERLARARLRTLLLAHPEIEIVGEADSVSAAANEVGAHQPDLIFLDISMPGGSGFELFTRIRVDAAVVFVTAYNQHAIQAFDVGALDYLLKPLEPERLAACLERVKDRVTPQADCISIADGKSMRLVPVSDIALIQAEGDYCEIVLRDGGTFKQKQTLVFWEKRVGDALFRVHRSALVALDAVSKVERSEGTSSQLLLVGTGQTVPVSRSRVTALKAALRSRSLG
jgi:two-component system LytT family response regulator